MEEYLLKEQTSAFLEVFYPEAMIEEIDRGVMQMRCSINKKNVFMKMSGYPMDYFRLVIVQNWDEEMKDFFHRYQEYLKTVNYQGFLIIDFFDPIVRKEQHDIRKMIFPVGGSGEKIKNLIKKLEQKGINIDREPLETIFKMSYQDTHVDLIYPRQKGDIYLRNGKILINKENVNSFIVSIQKESEKIKKIKEELIIMIESADKDMRFVKEGYIKTYGRTLKLSVNCINGTYECKFGKKVQSVNVDEFEKKAKKLIQDFINEHRVRQFFK